MKKRDTDPQPREVLYPEAGQARYEESLYPPEPDLAELLAHCWSVRWDLRNRNPHTVEVLPSPSVQLVVEGGRSRLHGVWTGKFTRVLEGVGDIFGVAFRPAGFRPFLGSSVSALTDRVLIASDVFGHTAETFAELLSSVDGTAERVEAAQMFIRSRMPAVDPNVATINRIVEQIADDRKIVRVDDIVRRTDVGKRSLQRLFKEYVGVNPKWVIQRYRLHEAAERLGGDEYVDLATLALNLGYADQAHFIRDFRAMVGQSPAGYARSARRDR